MHEDDNDVVANLSEEVPDDSGSVLYLPEAVDYDDAEDTAIIDADQVDEEPENTTPNPLLTVNRSLSDEEIDSRFCRHKYTDATAAGVRGTRRQFLAMARFLDMILPPGRAKAVAMTSLEESSMWAIKAIEERAPVKSE